MKSTKSEYVLMIKLNKGPYMVRYAWFDKTTKSTYKSLEEAKKAMALNQIAMKNHTDKNRRDKTYEMWIDFVKRETETTRIRV